MDEDDVIIEFYRVGNVVKVSAVDLATLTEVSIVGAPGLSDSALERVAIRKLHYVLAKEEMAHAGR